LARYYISITGLCLKRPWYLPRFWRHAMNSMAQAKQAEGVVLAKARSMNGVHHTLSVWEGEAAMRKFLYRGAHREAIRAFSAIAVGKTFGYSSDTIPDWPEVHRLWNEHGVDYEQRQAAE
jgi:hypothetical protein